MPGRPMTKPESRSAALDGLHPAIGRAPIALRSCAWGADLDPSARSTTMTS
jgi:hypothetical protein